MGTRNRYLVVLVTAMVAGLLGERVSTGVQPTLAIRQAVAPTGRLRVGVYPG